MYIIYIDRIIQKYREIHVFNIVWKCIFLWRKYLNNIGIFIGRFMHNYRAIFLEEYALVRFVWEHWPITKMQKHFLYIITKKAITIFCFPTMTHTLYWIIACVCVSTRSTVISNIEFEMFHTKEYHANNIHNYYI